MKYLKLGSRCWLSRVSGVRCAPLSHSTPEQGIRSAWAFFSSWGQKLSSMPPGKLHTLCSPQASQKTWKIAKYVDSCRDDPGSDLSHSRKAEVFFFFIICLFFWYILKLEYESFLAGQEAQEAQAALWRKSVYFTVQPNRNRRGAACVPLPEGSVCGRCTPMPLF